MSKALRLALELLEAIRAEDVKRCCELADELKKVMDTFKRSC